MKILILFGVMAFFAAILTLLFLRDCRKMKAAEKKEVEKWESL